jgi:hypothetical protein
MVNVGEAVEREAGQVRQWRGRQGSGEGGRARGAAAESVCEAVESER